MTCKSPFNVRSPVFFVELFQARHIDDHVSFRRVPLGVIFLSGLDDQIDDIGKATAATAAFFHRMVDLDGNDQLPTVLSEELDDRILDLPFGDVIATANQHFGSTWRTLTSIQTFCKRGQAMSRKNPAR
jgi:hypothetical protein